MKLLLLVALLVVYTYADTCEAVGISHVRTYSGGWWNFKKEGDYLLLENPGLTVQVRNRLWGQNSNVITGVALKFANADSFSITKKGFTECYVNGKRIILKQEYGPVLKLGEDCHVIRAEKELKILSKDSVIYIKENLPKAAENWPQNIFSM